MANLVKVKKLVSGSRNVLLSVFLKSDGVTGELNEEVILDPVEDLGLTTKARLTLQRIEYNIAGFDAIIEFDSGSVDDNFKWVMSEGANAPVDFRPWSGLVDDSGMDGNGKLKISTVGFTSSTDMGSILISLRV